MSRTVLRVLVNVWGIATPGGAKGLRVLSAHIIDCLTLSRMITAGGAEGLCILSIHASSSLALSRMITRGGSERSVYPQHLCQRQPHPGSQLPGTRSGLVH